MSIPFFILCYIALGIQLGIGDTLSFHGGAPNFVLLAAVFMSLCLPRNPAMIAALILGLAQDSLSQHTLGLYGLSYGMTALFIGTMNQAVYRQHPLAHVSLTLIAGLITAAVLELHSVIHPAPSGLVEAVTGPGMRDAIAPLVISAVYTAFLSWGVFWLLQRFKRFTPTTSRRAWG